MPASYFDVDGTLVSTNLVHPTVFYLLNQATPVRTALRLGRALLKAPAMGLAELVDRRTFNELLFSSYEGMSEDRLVLLADEVFEKVHPAVDLSRRSRSRRRRTATAGNDVVLVSGALDFILQPSGRSPRRRQDVIANRLEMKDGYATGQAAKARRRRAGEGAGHPRARASARARSRRLLRLQRQLLGRARCSASSVTPPR